MEEYIIEGLAVFSYQELTFTNIETNDSLSIPLIEAELMKILIENQGHVVERDTIFKEVLDRNFATSTNNNLNQYILHLRKHIQYIGIDSDIIITVPKIGYIINSDITIKKRQKAISHSLPTIPKEGIVNSKNLCCRVINIWSASMLFITIFVFLYIIYLYISYLPPSEYPQISIREKKEQTSSQKCKLHYLGTFSHSESIVANSTIDDDLHNEFLCNLKDSFDVYIHINKASNNKYRRFVAKCSAEACFSYYYSGERL